MFYARTPYLTVQYSLPSTRAYHSRFSLTRRAACTSYWVVKSVGRSFRRWTWRGRRAPPIQASGGTGLAARRTQIAGQTLFRVGVSVQAIRTIAARARWVRVVKQTSIENTPPFNAPLSDRFAAGSVARIENKSSYAGQQHDNRSLGSDHETRPSGFDREMGTGSGSRNAVNWRKDSAWQHASNAQRFWPVSQAQQ